MQDSRGGPDFCHGLQFDWLLLFGGLNDTCPHLTKNSRCVQRLPPKSCDLADCGLVAPPPHTLLFSPAKVVPHQKRSYCSSFPAPSKGLPSPPHRPHSREPAASVYIQMGPMAANVTWGGTCTARTAYLWRGWGWQGERQSGPLQPCTWQ